MPPKAAATSSANNLSPKEIELLAAMATLMGDVPQLDYDELAAMIGHKHTRNAKAKCRELFKKLKNAHQGQAGPSSSLAGKAEASDAEEDGEEEAAEEEEEKPAKKAAPAKKGSPVKKATPKKTVGKTTTPKKASSGGRKTPKGKGKKAKAEEAVDDEAEAEAEEDAAVTKVEPEDEKMMDEDEDGKLSQSLTSNNDLQPPVTTEVPLTVVINGETVVYTQRDVEVAKSHEVTLVNYLVWKAENNYDFYLNDFYVNEDQNTSASQGAVETSDKV